MGPVPTGSENQTETRQTALVAAFLFQLTVISLAITRLTEIPTVPGRRRHSPRPRAARRGSHPAVPLRETRKSREDEQSGDCEIALQIAHYKNKPLFHWGVRWKLVVAKAGIEPATHGFSVRMCEFLKSRFYPCKHWAKCVLQFFAENFFWIFFGLSLTSDIWKV